MLLDLALSNGHTSAENLLLKLFKSNTTPSQTSVASDFTAADFTGATTKTLTSASWGASSEISHVGVSVYNTALTWSCGSSQTVYGYYVYGSSSTTLYWAETFASPRSVVNGDTLSLTPQLSLNSLN